MRKVKLLIAALMLSAGFTAFAQNINVSGVVSDTAGNPIPGAGVLIQGASKGVSTDIDGKYTISAPKTATLVFKSIGYKDATVDVAGRSVVNVVLADDATALEGSVVVGYGSARKIGNLVGSVSTVTSNDIVEKPTANVADLLQGKVAGLQVFNTSGEPQSSVSLRLRGESSIT